MRPSASDKPRKFVEGVRPAASKTRLERRRTGCAPGRRPGAVSACPRTNDDVQHCGSPDGLPTTGACSCAAPSSSLSLWLLAPATAAAAAPATTGGHAAAEASGGITAAGQTVPAPEPRAAGFAVVPAEVPSEEGGRLTFRYRIEGRARTVARRPAAHPPRRAPRGGARVAGACPDRTRPRARVAARGGQARGRRVRGVAHGGRRRRPAAQPQPLRGTRPHGLQVTAPPAPEPEPAPEPAPTPAPEPTPGARAGARRPSDHPEPALIARPASAGGVFPVQGTWTFGGDGRALRRRPHRPHPPGPGRHRAEGTPVVAPEAGVVSTVAYQAAGAGYYVVLHGEDGRDLVFMHLQAGSIPVTKAAPVAAAQLLGPRRHHGHRERPAPALRDLAGRLVGVARAPGRSTRCRTSWRGRGRASLPRARRDSSVGRAHD